MEIEQVDQHLEKMVSTARGLVTSAVPLEDYASTGEHLADLVLELHEHLRKGGPLPARWTTKADGSNRS